MKRLRRFIISILPLVMISLLAGNSSAALKAVGPISAATTLPTWYQDTTNLALEPCLDQNGFCILTPNFDPAADPLTRTPPGAGLSTITATGPINDANFPDESFYFLADSIITSPTGVKYVYRAAMEAAFLAGVSPGQGITFLRINFKKLSGLTPSSTYTVTHPYGQFTFDTDALGDSVVTTAGQAFRTEDPLAPAPGVYFPPEMAGAVTTGIGPFLVRAPAAGGLFVDPLSGNTYIGDAVTPVPVVGGSHGNIFRIDGPNAGGPGVNSIETNLFTLAGKVFTGPISSPMTIDRSTYVFDGSAGQIDLFVTALPSANLTVTGTGIPRTPLTQDTSNPTKFFAHISFTATLPSNLNLENTLDTPTPTAIPHAIILSDEVNITQASYNPLTQELSIRAASRDKVIQLPTLTIPALATPNTLDANGALDKTLTTIPPMSVTVTSSKGGTATSLVSVVIPSPLTIAPSQIAPSGTNIATSAAFSFTPVPGATGYKIYYENLAGVGSFIDVTSTQAGCASGSGICTFTPATPFTSGTSYGWLVSAVNASGNGPFSTIMNFTTVTVVAATPPVAPTAISPLGANTLSTAPFIFSAVANATAYKIYYENLAGIGSFIDVTPAQAGCVSGIGACSFTPATPFTANTTYGWLVSASNAAGAGPWSSTLNFITTPATPAAPTALTPTGSGVATNAPFTFSAVAGATGYVIYSENLAGVGGFVSISAAQAGCPTGTGTCSYTPAIPFTATTTYGWLVSATNLNVQGPYSATLNFVTQ